MGLTVTDDKNASEVSIGRFLLSSEISNVMYDDIDRIHCLQAAESKNYDLKKKNKTFHKASYSRKKWKCRLCPNRIKEKIINVDYAKFEISRFSECIGYKNLMSEKSKNYKLFNAGLALGTSQG